MKEQDLEFISEILEKSRLLFYGEFEQYLNNFLKKMFQKDFRDYGFEEYTDNDFGVAYWFVLSWLDQNHLFGTILAIVNRNKE